MAKKSKLNLDRCELGSCISSTYIALHTWNVYENENETKARNHRTFHLSCDFSYNLAKMSFSWQAKAGFKLYVSGQGIRYATLKDARAAGFEGEIDPNLRRETKLDAGKR